MTLYTIKWTETRTHEIDVAADGESEALEEFWTQYNSVADSAWLDECAIDTDGPNDITIHFWRAIPLIPTQIQENP